MNQLVNYRITYLFAVNAVNQGFTAVNKIIFRMELFEIQFAYKIELKHGIKNPTE